MMVMMVFLFQPGQLSSQCCLTLHCLQQLRTGQLVPGRGDDGSMVIMLPQHGHCSIQLLLRNRIGPGEDDGGGSFDLVIVELAKVLHVYLYLAGVHNRHGIAQRHFCARHLLGSSDHIRQLAHAGGFNDDPVGVILADDLLQSLAKVAHQRAADTAGVHFGNVDTGLLQKTAVDADLTELIFNQDQLLAGIGLLDHLLDERGFSGA